MKSKFKKAFTLTEAVVSMALIILASIAVISVCIVCTNIQARADYLFLAQQSADNVVRCFNSSKNSSEFNEDFNDKLLFVFGEGSFAETNSSGSIIYEFYDPQITFTVYQNNSYELKIFYGGEAIYEARG